MKRNVGTTNRLDTRITKLDPAAVAVKLGSITVANPQIIKPTGPNEILQGIMDSMSAAGQFGRSLGSMQQAQRRRVSKDFEAALRGDAQMDATQDELAMSAMFKNDTLDKQDISGEAGILSRYETLEDELLDRLAMGQEAGVAPEVVLGGWVREQIGNTTSGLDAETAAIVQEEYSRTYFPKVLKSASDWWNSRVDARQEMLRDGIISNLAVGAGAFPTPAALTKATKGEDSALEQLTPSEADSMFISAGNIASERANWQRATDLYDAVPVTRRTEAWYEGRAKLREGELQHYETGLTRALIDGAETDLWVQRFQPVRQRVERPGVGWETRETFLPQDPLEVARFANALDSYVKHPSVPLVSKAQRINELIIITTGLAQAEAIQAHAKLPDPEDHRAEVAAARKESRYQAGLDILELREKGSIQYKDKDKNTITVKVDSEHLNTEFRQLLTTKYGRDGLVFYDDFLEARDSGSWNRTAAGGSQDAVSAGFKKELADAEDDVEPDQEGNRKTARQKRREIVDRAFAAAVKNQITFAQLNSLFAFSEAEERRDPERWPDDLQDVSSAIIQSFGDSAGMQFDLGPAQKALAQLSIQTKAHDPAAKSAAIKLQREFRDAWRTWSSANASLIENDPHKYQEQRAAWINQNQDYYTRRAINLGKQYAPDAYNARERTTIMFAPFTNSGDSQ